MEELTLDGLALNDGNPWLILDGSFNFTPAKKKLNWASSALSDGSALIGKEDHYENAELSFRLRMVQQADSDTAFAVLHNLTAKLQAARDARDGLPLVWTPANSSRPTTFYVLDAEYDELGTTNEAGWTKQALQVVVHLYMRPFGYRPEQLIPLGLSDPFEIDSITNGLWRWEAGTGTMAIAFGGLVMSSTAAKRIYRPSTMVDQTATIEFVTGTTITGSTVGVSARRLDASNRLEAVLVSNALLLRKVDAGSTTTLATSSTVSLSTATPYWLQASFVGDDLDVSLFVEVDDPRGTVVGAPLASVSHTLSGANATKFGTGIRGNPGIVVTPLGTGWAIPQWTLRGAPDIRNSEPIFGVEVPDVPGEVDAEGRLVITENSSQNRSHVEWGRETRGFDVENVPPFLIDSDALKTSGFAGTQTTWAFGGMYDPNATGNDAIYATNISETVPLTVCGTGSQVHVGTFKIKARVIGTEGIMLRLAWRVGDGPLARNNFSEPILDFTFQERELGTIIVPEAGIGDQTWEGRIEAYGVDQGQLLVDYLEIIPLEGYGIARAPLQPIIPTVYATYDHFNQTAGNLHGKTLGGGGTWVSSSVDATDFTVVAGTSHWAQRAEVSDADLNSGRYALAGSTNYAGIQAQVDVGTAAALDKTVDYEDKLRMGLVLRYVDANNWLMVVRQTHSVPKAPGITNDYTHSTRLRVYKRVAGTVTQIGGVLEGEVSEIHRRLIASVDAAGVWSVYSYWPGSKQPAQPTLSGQDAVLATGGSLASGKIGLYDAYTLAAPALTRTYDNFVAFAPVPDVVMYSGKKLQVRADRTEREAAAGSLYAKVPMYRGGRFWLPPAGSAGRTSRVAVKARRADVDGGLPDFYIGDTVTVQMFATPRSLTP